MFRAAYKIACEFTRPVIISKKVVGGDTASVVAAYVVLNADGWILTAAHVIKSLADQIAETKRVADHAAKKKALQADTALTQRERQRQLSGLGHLDRKLAERTSAWWAEDKLRLVEATAVGEVDIAVGRLEPFDPASVKSYPVLKDPTKDFEPGASLCRLGFPFHAVIPTWNDQTGGFVLPHGAVPVPRFPIEGIFTRTVEVNVPATKRKPYPFKFLETSSPGLRGQSGGPIFDVQGAIWGIQSQTQHYALGFDPLVPGQGINQQRREHQFLNAGWGTHVETLIGFLNEQKIKFQTSAH